MRDRGPGHYDELDEAHREALAKQERQVEQSVPPSNVIDEAEAKIAAFRKEQMEKVEAGLITLHQAIYRERQYEQKLASDINRAQPETQPAAPEQVQEPPREQPAKKEEPSLPPEKNQADWRRMISDPDYRREVEQQEREVKEPQRQQTQETPQQARPAGDQPEKKAEEKEVDWRRALTDPDYRRQAREQERAEKMERAGEHRQEQEQGPQRPPSGRER